MISHLDHFVLTTANLEACLRFYTVGLGMQHETFGEGRHALRFGSQKINLHVRGHEIEPKAHVAAPGTLDLCFIVDAPLEDVITRLANENIPILLGPVTRTGATGPIQSVYLRDPDQNLIELSRYIDVIA